MKKKILSICLVAALAITAIAGASLAYFTDTDDATNTFTVGNVKIEQNEKDREGNDFEQDQKLYPIVNDSKDNDGYHLGGNYIDKIVTVTNTGSEEAFVRTHIAIPAALDDGPASYNASANVLHWNGASAEDTFALANLGNDNDWYWGKSTDTDWPGNAGDWNFYTTKIGGVDYNVYVATHASAIASKETTAPSLYGIYLDKNVNHDENGYFIVRDGKRETVDMTNTTVYVLSEAVQAKGWDNTDANVAFKALDQAFGTVGSYNPWEK